ncbi:MAG: 1-phosphofructokinase family hexose kinase [Gillisia sp.]|nr:1-phosphofructokinase family hexose kinase [Gillisia sp.]
MKNIITLTVNPALDSYTTIDHLEPNKKLRCQPPMIDPGGGGVNVARVIHRLGGNATAIYTRGGHTGKIYSDLLDKEGIDQDPVEIKQNLRENFAVTETSTGNLFRFGLPGPVLEKSEYKSILDKIENISNAEFLVASGSLCPEAPVDFFAQVAKKAKKNNLKFILDTSGKALSEILKVGAFLLKPNNEELEDLTGKKATNQKEQKKLLLEILDNYPVEVIVLSLGAKGAILATGNKATHFPALKVFAQSSIGAGDSMVAGIVYSLSLGKSLEEAVVYGLACGSATLKSPGTELLTKKDADLFYKKLVMEKLKA